ncbi:ABC transporter permease [Echinicola sp. 20G]|uniref:ABC transporter permease n=1 Tax=Echinicola sp. 20G TaxID=2781961 RepID=UPI001F2E1795|nr:ABC transporter permease subunit [Echinicola sp. 20G]
MKAIINSFERHYPTLSADNPTNPFWVMVRKEVSGHIRSWRFLILLGLVLLTFFGATAVALANLRDVVDKVKNADQLLLYLKLLTTTEGSLPPFHVFLNFLGPIMGISLGFDAMNSEQQNRTLTRIMAQPVYRDNLLLSKFLGAMVLVVTLLFSLSLLMIGGGMVITGVMIEAEEVLRIIGFNILCAVYIGFWLGLAILLSTLFKQASTSALTAIGIWLFFTVFYQIIINFAVKAFVPSVNEMSQAQVLHFNKIILNLLRLAPSQLYTDATTTLLMPSVRSLGPVTMEQMAGAIPSPLPLSESLMIVWPQLSGLIAATVMCFALSYYCFMKREIRT